MDVSGKSYKNFQEIPGEIPESFIFTVKINRKIKILLIKFNFCYTCVFFKFTFFYPYVTIKRDLIRRLRFQ